MKVFFPPQNQAERGVHAIDIAKFLIDQQIHPPTVYFPISVPEAIMIEPTETESKQTMDHFIEKMIEADKLSQTDPAAFKEFPKTMPVTRPDEVKAARDVKTSFFLSAPRMQLRDISFPTPQENIAFDEVLLSFGRKA